MVLKIFVVLLLVAVAFFQSLHGLFSALIMFVLTVLCATLALTHYEWLHETLLASFIPEYGHAVGLMGLFLIPLLLLRLGVDKVIGGNMVVAHPVDRVGSGVFGLGTGFVVSGMVAIGFQLLPFDAELLGFQRFVAVDASGEPIAAEVKPKDYPPDVRYETQNLWLDPDGLTVRLVSMLADGAFSGSQRFGDVHPDLLTELHWRRNGVQRESRHWVAPDSLTVHGAKVIRPTERWIRKRPTQSDGTWSYEPGPALPPGRMLVAVKVTLSSADKTADPDGQHRFRGGQFRLVCRDRETGATEQFPLAGLCLKPESFADDGKYFCFDQAEAMVIPASSEPLGVLFEVPEGLDPWFVEYKASARAEIRKVSVRAGVTEFGSGTRSAGSITLASHNPAPGAQRGNPGSEPPPRRDRISSRYIKEGEARFSADLPIPLARRALADQGPELRGSAFERGHVVVDLAAMEDQDKVTQFAVPEGVRLFQLGVEKEEARSMFGRAIQFTRRTMEQYTVIDERGDVYHRIGEIRVADVGERETLEMQYWPDAEMPERCIQEFRRVKEQDLEGDFALIYLYLLPEGRKPVRFSTGGKKVRDIGEVRDH